MFESLKMITTRRRKRPAYRLCLCLPVLIAALTLLSCSGENASPPQGRTAANQSTSPKADWAEMLLRPTDSTRQAWLEAMPGWPAVQHLTVDSNGHATVADLEFAFHPWVVKNLDFDGDTLMGGLRLSVTVAASYVPSHLLMKEFFVDSVQLFKPGEDAPAVSKKLFPARRKFIEGVWQVEFVQQGNALPKPDFPDGTQFVPRAFVSWNDKKIVFQMPATTYEYIRSPQPMNGQG